MGCAPPASSISARPSSAKRQTRSRRRPRRKTLNRLHRGATLTGTTHRLLIVGVFGFHAAVYAQSPGGPRFDGTYRLMSSAKVNENYVAKGGQSSPCPTRTPGPLTIRQAQARYTAESGREVTGTVGPQGELSMRSAEPGESRPNELKISGTIDAAGMARARQIGFSCSYDFVWQK